MFRPPAVAALPKSFCRTAPPTAAPIATEALDLPNGLEFHFPAPMRGAAKFLIREIFHRGRYHRPGFEIRLDDTVIDIGANMGLFSLWAAPQARHGRVIAVEPTAAIDALEHNAQLNLLSHVTPVKAAIGRDGEMIELEHYPGFNIVTHQQGWRPAAITRAAVRLLYGRPGVEPVRVAAPCISLGRLMDEHEIDAVNFLKVDCEGAEYGMFRDLAPRHWNRIERIAMEFHELHPGHRHAELVTMLRDRGFQVAVRKPWLDYYCMKFGEIWAWR